MKRTMIFTVYGDAMLKGRKLYEDHVTFYASSWEEAIKLGKEKYMQKENRNPDDPSVIDDFIPVSVIKGFHFEENVEMRMIGE